MNADLREETRAEWRQLGFYYERDDVRKEWLLVGSRGGLQRFSQLLSDYAADPRHDRLSEHEHYGPYLYLEVMTSVEAGVDAHSIHGPLPSIGALARLVEAKIHAMQPGARAPIGELFAPSAAYALVLDLREDGFDPASLDSGL